MSCRLRTSPSEIPEWTNCSRILLAALAVACTVFGGVFLLVLLIFRMTHKLLLAIELSARRA